MFDFLRELDSVAVGIDEFQPVGAAWYRLFEAAEPGYGFVDEDTPELTIAIVPSRRGKGLGEQLLTSLLDHARKEGYARISLSVEPDNPAIHLYEQHGFAKVGERAAALATELPTCLVVGSACGTVHDALPRGR